MLVAVWILSFVCAMMFLVIVRQASVVRSTVAAFKAQEMAGVAMVAAVQEQGKKVKLYEGEVHQLQLEKMGLDAEKTQGHIRLTQLRIADQEKRLNAHGHDLKKI